ncbi:hypothetical protein DM01DRAFT_1074219 [Hesseltinella vesiculosa]|uniref:Uncharacterized protein n=1 Tax=Hesseltinella vesiculosa TaxID=101127 RepID=A0A1X2GVX1_9FUNG|nr:hypothetical protein DM01DRAFT_1074219 [Hesseltinella vesiculosa]
MARFSLCLERHRDLLDTVIMVYQQQDRDGRQPAGGSHQQQQQYKQLQQQLQQLRRAMDECKRQYDMQAKKQQHEHLALKRQYQQMVLAQERSRTQHNAIVMTLKQKLDGLIKEKKKMTKRAKQDTDRHRERERQLAKQILQLERKMAKHEQAKLRLDHDLQHQRASCKRSKEDTIAVATQLQTIAWVMTTIVDANRSSLSIAHRNLLAKAIAGARARSHLIPVKKQISTSVKKSKKRASFQR